MLLHSAGNALIQFLPRNPAEDLRYPFHQLGLWWKALVASALEYLAKKFAHRFVDLKEPQPFDSDGRADTQKQENRFR